MKTYEQIAESAYAAYTKRAGQSDPDGLAAPLPAWDELHEDSRQCWVAAVKQVAAELALIH